MARLEDKTRAISEKLALKIGGEKARQFIQDFNAIFAALGDARLAETSIDEIDMFLKTEDVIHLNPLALHVANQLKYIYEKVKNRAHALPDEVLAALPEEVRQTATGAVWITEREADIGHMSAPHIAFGWKDMSAMTIFDMIIWRASPPPAIEAGLHTWSHELFHVRQYRAAGSIGSFIADYVANELGRNTKYDKNLLEVQADEFACQYFPGGHPSYLPGNKCPQSG